jgi:hypothetical protein
MIFKSLENFEINDFLLLLSTTLMTYVAYYYYKYYTRINPLPGPFPFPIIGNLPQIIWKFKGDSMMFNEYCYKKYGSIHEIYAVTRTIILCRSEYLENFLSKNAYGLRVKESSILEEFGIKGKGVAINNDFKLWTFNRYFFNQAILSPKFTDEVIVWTNKLFNELESYWDKLFLKEEIIKENKNKLDITAWLNYYINDITIRLLTGEKSYTMAAYFDSLSDEKSALPSATVEESVEFVKALHKQTEGFTVCYVIPSFLRRHVPIFKNLADEIKKDLQFVTETMTSIIRRRRREIENTPLNKPLSHDMLTSMIIKNTFRDTNYVEIGEVNRAMTDSEICANLREGIISGTLKVNF